VSRPRSIRRGLPPAAGAIPVPADRRFRRPDNRPVRATWRRFLTRRAAWWTGGFALAVAATVWAGTELLSAAALNIDRVVVRGNSRVTAAEIEQRLEGIRGENILRADLEGYRARLLALPWIGGVEVRRLLPSTLQVRVAERRPLAIARHRTQLYLASADGVVLDRFGPAYQEFDLPIVDGAMRDGESGPVLDAERMALVGRLFDELTTRPDVFARLSQVDVRDVRNAVVLLDGEPAELRLGDREFLARIRRYEEAAPALRDQRPVTEYYDLRFGDFIWVK
jgi:cell division septal protein FtsQ